MLPAYCLLRPLGGQCQYPARPSQCGPVELSEAVETWRGCRSRASGRAYCAALSAAVYRPRLLASDSSLPRRNHNRLVGCLADWSMPGPWSTDPAGATHLDDVEPAVVISQAAGGGLHQPVNAPRQHGHLQAQRAGSQRAWCVEQEQLNGEGGRGQHGEGRARRVQLAGNLLAGCQQTWPAPWRRTSSASASPSLVSFLE